METFFLHILNMSIAAGWLTLVVVVLRFLLRKAPKWTRLVLWAFVGIRLVCPFSFESAWSLMPRTESMNPIATYSQGDLIENTDILNIVGETNRLDNSNQMTSLTATPEQSVDPIQIWIFIASLVWILGMVLFAVYAGRSFWRVRKNVSESIHLEGNIWVCDHINTPFILGIIKPRIYLPSSMNDEQKFYVLAHERAHLKRHDHWWKLIGYALLLVYWFYPLVWLAYHLFSKDMELACDEYVIKEFDMQEKKTYSTVLLEWSTANAHRISPLAFGEISVKQRVKEVLHYKKPTIWIVSLAIICCVVAAICFLTNPESEPDENEAEMSETEPLPATEDNVEQGITPEQPEGEIWVPQNDEIDILARFQSIPWDEIESRNLTFSESNADFTDIFCIGELPEYDIKLYGYNDEEVVSQGVAIQMGEAVNYFDWIYTTPQALYPSLYWDAEKAQLQVSLKIFTGTGVNAEELHVLQRYDTGTLEDHAFTITEYSVVANEQLDFTFNPDSKLLTISNRVNGELLGEVTAPETVAEITDYEVGLISSFSLGETIYFKVKPGYYADGFYGVAEYTDMPELIAPVLMEENNGTITFSLGAFERFEDE